MHFALVRGLPCRSFLDSWCAHSSSLSRTSSLHVAFAQAPVPSNPEIERRVDALLKKMTLEQKIDYIGGTGFAVRSMPTLGVPAFEMSDGPLGVRSNQKFPSTTYAAAGSAAAPGRGGSARSTRCRPRPRPGSPRPSCPQPSALASQVNTPSAFHRRRLFRIGICREGGKLDHAPRCSSTRTARPVMSYMPELNIQTFRARTMIMASFGQYLPVSGHDHGTTLGARTS